MAVFLLVIILTMSVFSVTSGRQNFSQTVFEDVLEFLNDIHRSRENSSRQTNIFFLTFACILMNCHLASAALCRACLVNVKKLNDCAHLTSQNLINHLHRALLCASLHYTSRIFFFVWWLFFYMIGQVMTWVFFKCLPAIELVWQQIHLCLVIIST